MRDSWLITIMKNVARRLNIKYAPFDLKTGSFFPAYGWEYTNIEYPVYMPLSVPSDLEDSIVRDIIELKKNRAGLRLLSISSYLLIEKDKFNILARFVK